MTDGQTDGRTDRASIAASRGKNWSNWRFLSLEWRRGAPIKMKFSKEEHIIVSLSRTKFPPDRRMVGHGSGITQEFRIWSNFLAPKGRHNVPIKTSSKSKVSLICVALYYELLISKVLRYIARVNAGSHSFTWHPHIYSKVEWVMPAFTPSRKLRSPLAGTHFPYRAESTGSGSSMLNSMLIDARVWVRTLPRYLLILAMLGT